MAEKKVNIKKLSKGYSNIYMLDPKDIYIDPDWNERNMLRPDAIKHIEALALSISKVGIKDPLTVVGIDDKIHLTDGYCRMAAINLAAEKYGTVIEGVKVMIEDRGTDEADHLASMITRNAGLEFTFSEQARVVKRMLALGLDKKEVAERCGKSLTHIDNCILLLEADVKIMKYLDEDKISQRLVLDTIRKKGSKALPIVEKAIEKAKASGKSKAKNTAKKTPPSAPVEKKIAWHKHGPEFAGLLEQLQKEFEAPDSPDVPDYVGDAVTFYKNYKEAEGLTIEPAEEGG